MALFRAERTWPFEIRLIGRYLMDSPRCSCCSPSTSLPLAAMKHGAESGLAELHDDVKYVLLADLCMFLSSLQASGLLARRTGWVCTRGLFE